MNVLVINNNSAHIDNLVAFLRSQNHTVTALSWDRPDLLEKYIDYDLTVLSGGRGLAVPNHRDDLSKQIQIAKETQKPLVGICLGFQIIGDAYGAEMEYENEKSRGLITIDVVHEDRIFQGMKQFKAFLSHKWHVTNIFEPLIALAKSGKTVQVIKHRSKPIYGFQFHPEVAEAGNQGADIMRNLLKEIEIKTL